MGGSDLDNATYYDVPWSAYKDQQWGYTKVNK
jgi:hypothetical protein